MTLELSAFVEGDLDRIAAFIAADNPEPAVSFIREIRARLKAIGRQPLLYRFACQKHLHGPILSGINGLNQIYENVLRCLVPKSVDLSAAAQGRIPQQPMNPLQRTRGTC